MRRCNQRIGLNVIICVTQHIGREENEIGKEDKEHGQSEAVFHRVIRVERHRILLAFDRNTDRIIIARHMQCPNMQNDHTQNQEWDEVMQREEAIERRIVD